MVRMRVRGGMGPQRAATTRATTPEHRLRYGRHTTWDRALSRPLVRLTNKPGVPGERLALLRRVPSPGGTAYGLGDELGVPTYAPVQRCWWILTCDTAWGPSVSFGYDLRVWTCRARAAAMVPKRRRASDPDTGSGKRSCAAACCACWGIRGSPWPGVLATQPSRQTGRWRLVL